MFRIARRLNRRVLLVLILALILLLAILGWWAVRRVAYSPTHEQLGAYLGNRAAHPELISTFTQPCPGAPFRLPSAGFVGFLYSDPTEPYSPLNPHPGIDIFGSGDPGTVPIYAAYDGYLTRLPDWKSAVIIRIPQDPLDPSRQIWTYYTHMASLSGGESYISRDFPLGVTEKFVSQGTLIGYQGLYAGTGAPIAMHLHFSVVRSDANGAFLNETRIQNTLDPSPYFGFNLNATKNPVIPVRCGS